MTHLSTNSKQLARNNGLLRLGQVFSLRFFLSIMFLEGLKSVLKVVCLSLDVHICHALARNDHVALGLYVLFIQLIDINIFLIAAIDLIFVRTCVLRQLDRIQLVQALSSWSNSAASPNDTAS